MIRRFDIEQGGVVVCEREDAPILVYALPTAEEREILVKTFGLDEHTVASALDPDEQARLELEDDHAAVIFKRPQNYSSSDQFVFRVTSVGAFLFQNRLILVAAEDVPLFEGRSFQKVLSLSDVFLKVLYRTIFHFYGHLKAMNAISNEIEQKINTSLENKYLLHMFTLEKSLVYYLDAIGSNQTVMGRIRNNSGKIGLKQDQMELLDDIVIENTQCAKQAEIYSNILSSMMDARASIVNNNLNILMKQLTIISVVFMPLNLLASIGGMSEYTIFTSRVHWAVSYGLFGLAMLVLGLITFWALSRGGREGRGRKIRPER